MPKIFTATCGKSLFKITLRDCIGFVAGGTFPVANPAYSGTKETSVGDIGWDYRDQNGVSLLGGDPTAV
ncbi:uncharacterized protein FOMMEDRAFT_163371 [Fomitiporia mediterranea MF3/22]|uniref:Uncharacterized protein n=1 Tax=Fomitiporia mediterranea (strain MF3/22) TaxID=694068 RepID=R7SFD4_FOMME|nr:uncharacterized protein FOMMEDRAFT_163371 [Fomitiporia mediterranea MF3/22]EJC97436.1 hypothetical protein FOMMEDRAFT_163371 [Fomitiporia mediterranea MF3/22]